MSHAANIVNSAVVTAVAAAAAKRLMPHPKRSKPKNHRFTPAPNIDLGDSKEVISTVPAGTNLLVRPHISFGPARHGRLQGLRMSGRQRIAVVAAYTALASFSTTSSVKYQLLDPTVLLNPLQGIATQFQRFRFTKLRFVYRSSNPSNNNGAVFFGYSSDALTVNGSITSASISTLANSVETNVWHNEELECTLERDNLYYNYSLVTNNQDCRWGNQGTIMIGGAFTGYADGAVLGDMWMEYTVELYEPGDNSTLKWYKMNYIHGEDDESISERRRLLKHHNILALQKSESEKADLFERDMMQTMKVPPALVGNQIIRTDGTVVPAASVGWFKV